MDHNEDSKGIAEVCNNNESKRAKRLSKSKAPISVDSFDLLSVLGEGKFGTVLLVRKKESGKLFAMKIIKKMVVQKR